MRQNHTASGWFQHTNLLVSVWYAHVSLPMCFIESSRCLRGVLYTYTAGLPTNNGMLPASIFDILARLALAAHTCAGGAQITRFRRDCIENILRVTIHFLKP